MLEFRRLRSRVALQILLTVAIVPFVFPLAVMVGVSATGDGLLANYAAVLSRPELPVFFFNSLRICAGVVLLSYVITMLAAYALAKLPLRGRELSFYLIVGALTLPSAALIVPLFITIRQIGLYNNPLAVILPLAALQTAFNVLIARSFISSIPDEILEAARVDGAGSFSILFRIILPLSRPITAVVIVWSFIGAWNEYLLPLLFLQDTSQQTLTLLPTFFRGQFAADQTKILAASVVIALPTVICYIVFQRFFERGLTAGALK
jgi:raffinose/stachyose/melibiose transport system permease protein